MADEDVMKVMRTPKVYETVDEVLEANSKWKAEQIEKYKDRLRYLKDRYIKVSSMSDEILYGASEEVISETNKRLMELKSKIVKLEQMIKDYENRPW